MNESPKATLKAGSDAHIVSQQPTESSRGEKMEPLVGFEPTTCSLRILCLPVPSCALVFPYELVDKRL
jgi:hypothetical protein